MKLDEVIQHAKEVACNNGDCAYEHEQLAEWLTELQERRDSELRPTIKYINSSPTKQMMHIISELAEVMNEIGSLVDDGDMDALPKAVEELIDLQTSCETMLVILGLDDNRRREARKQVIAKNAVRHYYEVVK